MSEIHKYVVEKTNQLNEDNSPYEEITKSMIQKIYEEEKLLLLKQKMKLLVKREWEQGIIHKDFRKLYDKLSVDENDKCEWIWLTINPRPDIEIKETKKVVEKYVKRTFIEKYVYVYEQRGSKENKKPIGTGHHCHLLIKRNIEANVSIYDIKKRTKMSFKNITDVNNNKIFHYKNMPEKYVQDKINYMTNKNLDEEHKDKEQKQEMDVEWRIENDLKEMYNTLELENKNNMLIYKNGEAENEETDSEVKEQTTSDLIVPIPQSKISEA